MVKDLPVPGGPITSVSGRRSAWRSTRVCAVLNSAPARIGPLGASSGEPQHAGDGLALRRLAASPKIAASGVDISPRLPITCSSVSTPRASVGRRTSAIAEAQSNCTGLSCSIRSRSASSVCSSGHACRSSVRRSGINSATTAANSRIGVHVEGRGGHLRQDRLGVGLRLLVVLGVDQRGQQREVDMLLFEIDAEIRAASLPARCARASRAAARSRDRPSCARSSGRPRPTRKIEP